jgi:hypothetical protein
MRVKWPAREADHSPPSSAEVKEWVELYLHSPNTPPWRSAQLKNSTLLYFTLLFMNALNLSVDWLRPTAVLKALCCVMTVVELRTLVTDEHKEHWLMETDK